MVNIISCLDFRFLQLGCFAVEFKGYATRIGSQCVKSADLSKYLFSCKKCLNDRIDFSMTRFTCHGHSPLIIAALDLKVCF